MPPAGAGRLRSLGGLPPFARFLALLLLIFYPLPAAILTAQNAPRSDTEQEEDAALSDAEQEEEDYLLFPPEEKELIFIAPAEITEERPDVVTREEMDRDGSRDLWEAVRTVPGVILSGGGARNDSGISVRGFDSASVPVFVDGVTQANPYRGDNDAARMLSGDLESITIEKGYSTLLLGPNTMGGAILIRTARPKAPFEASVTSALGLDSLGKSADNYQIASVGVSSGLFYGKTTFQYRGVDHFRLPYDFKPVRNNPQGKGERLWSDSNDIKLTLLAGWTPFYNMDFSLTWIYQDSYKGFSPPSVNGRDYEIWEWPYYTRNGVNFQGEWLPDMFTVKAAAYFQKFDNRLLDYVTWASYLADMASAPSDYDDYTLGFRLEGGWEINGWNKLEAALNFRQDDHSGLTGEVEGVHVNEDIWSFAAAYTVNPFKPLRVNAAAGFDMLWPNTFWGRYNELLKDYPDQYVEKTAVWKLWVAEAGVYFDVNPRNELRLTYARKNHFPTMFQRYSSRIGEIKPNPRLGPEWADHFELGFRGRPFSTPDEPDKPDSPKTGVMKTLEALTLNAAVYYSLVTQKIVEIRVPKPDFTAVTIPYSVNLDSVAMWGVETGLDWTFSAALTAGASFSWNRYQILKTSNGVVSIALYPDFTASVHAEFSPIPALSLCPSLQYVGSRFAGTDGGAELDGYFLVNLKAAYEINGHFSVTAAVDNLFDTLYEIRPYFPQPGRGYTFSVTAKY